MMGLTDGVTDDSAAHVWDATVTDRKVDYV